MLRQVDVPVSQGVSCRGGSLDRREAVHLLPLAPSVSPAEHRPGLNELSKEDDRLRKAVSDLKLEKQILREAASGNFERRPRDRRDLAREAGLEGRASFLVTGASQPLPGPFDLACFFDCLHDLGHPMPPAAPSRRWRTTIR
jgi:hypothetical protein